MKKTLQVVPSEAFASMNRQSRAESPFGERQLFGDGKPERGGERPDLADPVDAAPGRGHDDLLGQEIPGGLELVDDVEGEGVAGVAVGDPGRGDLDLGRAEAPDEDGGAVDRHRGGIGREGERPARRGRGEGDEAAVVEFRPDSAVVEGHLLGGGGRRGEEGQGGEEDQDGRNGRGNKGRAGTSEGRASFGHRAISLAGHIPIINELRRGLTGRKAGGRALASPVACPSFGIPR